MQAFKKRVFFRIVYFIFLVVMVIGSLHILGEALAPTTFDYYFEHDVEEIIKNEEPVEALFLGSSRIYMSINPGIIEEELGYKNVLVAGTANQLVSGSYYYLIDMVERVHPQRVFLGVTWDLMLDDFEEQTSLIVYDRLSFKNKLRFLIDCFDSTNRMLTFKASRYVGNILDYRNIREQHKSRKLRGYNTFDPNEEYYWGKGYVYTYNSYINGTIPLYGERFMYSDNDILPLNEEYLRMCVDYCKDKGIEVTLISGLMSLAQIYNIVDYKEADRYYSLFAQENGISYYNLNLLKGREDFLSDECMRDRSHVNGNGAEIVSEKLTDILKCEATGDYSNILYESYDDMVDAEVRRIVAVDADFEILASDYDEQSQKIKCMIRSFQDDSINPYYNVEVSYDGEEFVSLVGGMDLEEVVIDVNRLSGFWIRIMAIDKETGIGASQVFTF